MTFGEERLKTGTIQQTHSSNFKLNLPYNRRVIVKTGSCEISYSESDLCAHVPDYRS